MPSINPPFDGFQLHGKHAWNQSSVNHCVLYICIPSGNQDKQRSIYWENSERSFWMCKKNNVYYLHYISSFLSGIHSFKSRYFVHVRKYKMLIFMTKRNSINKKYVNFERIYSFSLQSFVIKVKVQFKRKYCLLLAKIWNFPLFDVNIL